MITRIELENFKGIRERVALDLKPITLLFGANSSGKSTVIHALHYALEVLRNQNLDADRTTLGGDSVDLGGFRNLVHAHDLERRITMLFEFEADGSLADYTEGISDITPEHRVPPGPNLEDVDLDDRISTAWVRFEVGWSHALGAPQVFSYEVGTNGLRESPVIRIEAGANKGQTASLLLRVDHPIFGDPQLQVERWVQTPTGRAPHFTEDNEITSLLGDADIKTKRGMVSLPVYDQLSAVPIWRRPFRLWLADDTIPIAPSFIEVRRIMSKLGVGIGELLVAKLERLLYLGPLRTIPPRTYRPPLTEDLARWAEGLGAWDALHRHGDQFVSRASDWMASLETGYRIVLRRVVELDGAAAESLQELIKQLGYSESVAKPRSKKQSGSRTPKFSEADEPIFRAALSQKHLNALRSATVRKEVVLIDERNGVVVRPADVGVGISQVLPVIVAALYRGKRGAGAFVAIEQPELHVHPKLQVALADLFIEQSSAGSVSDHWFLLETHSEHILLRLLRRIREQSARPVRGGGMERVRGRVPGSPRGQLTGDTTEDDADAEGPVPFTPERISVIYVQRGEDGTTRFVPLRIDETGEFLDVWPEGFFDERREELL